MKKAMVVAAAALACAATAQASSWRLVSSAKSNNSFYASANVFKTGIKNVHGLAITWTATRLAKVDGSVSCNKGLDFDSYDYSFHGLKGVKRMRVPYSGAECSVILSGTLENGGGIVVRLYKR